MTVALARPSLAHFDSWSDTVAEFGDAHIDGAGLDRGQASDRSACEAFIEKAELYADPQATLPEGHVACDYFWITDDGEVVGFIAFRRELNDWLRQHGGHIGYSVRPSRRRQGIARAALGLVLDRARAAGYDRVMLSCDDTNVGSYRTIEGAGGELEDIIDEPGAEASGCRLRRYWIAL
jgi:predicted acetyltransferase